MVRYFGSLVDTSSNEGICHIEIGVLFGAGVIYAHNASQQVCRRIPIIAIDPFKGFYGASVDPISGLDVTESRFRSNLSLFQIPAEDLEVISGYSADPAVIQQCRTKRALSVLIDGDHSYNGVLSDWRNFSQLVVPGGYVLIDDYRNPSWPEIERCVDAEIRPYLGSEWSERLIIGRSLVLQRRGK